MADLLQRFSGNPFSTPVGQRIEQATDPSLTNEDWALYMEICDMINGYEDGPRDAVRAIKRRLQQTAGKNFNGFKLTLTVLETCVKNCEKRFHILVTNKDFVQDLVKLIGPKNEPPPEIQEKVLSLIQSWAEAFHGQPEMQGVSQVYNELRNKGIEFPKSSTEPKVPIYTPQRTSPAYKGSEVASSPPRMGSSPPAYPGTGGGRSAASESYPIHLSPEQLNKLKAELDIVQKNMKVLSEMLTEMKPGQEHRDDWELLVQLYNTCHTMQRRIMELIEKIANEEVTNELLRINDDLNNLFMRFDRYQKKRERDPNSEPSTSTVSGSANKKTTNIPSLIDFTDEPDTTDVASKMKELEIKPSAQPPAPDDKEFDMFAQSRSASGPGATVVAGSGIGIPSKPELRPKDPAPVAAGLPVTEQEQEKEMEEIERWLNTKPGEPSMSFEAFLERRANALDKQPMKKPDQDSSLI